MRKVELPSGLDPVFIAHMGHIGNKLEQKMEDQQPQALLIRHSTTWSRSISFPLPFKSAYLAFAVWLKILRWQTKKKKSKYQS